MKHLKTLSLLAVSACVLPAAAQEKTDTERRGLFNRLFNFDDQTKFELPVYSDKVHDVYMDRESDTINARVDPKPEAGHDVRENDPIERYPEIPGYNTIRSHSQQDIEDLIEEIYKAYEARIRQMDPPDLRRSKLMNGGKGGGVAGDELTVWGKRVKQSIWGSQSTSPQSISSIYTQTIEHSNQIKVFRDLPLIRETGIQEADGEFDTTLFLDGGIRRTNEPSGSRLTTSSGTGRFTENENYLEGGLRKKIFTGGEVTASNRFATLNNNSNFLNPARQGSSEFVLSFAQPLMQGRGYHYNHSKFKIAKYDARMASSEFVRQLQSHLVEVNRAYWALYYSRANYLLTKDLTKEIRAIVSKLEERSDLDALESELLRARSSLATADSSLIRAEMAVRNSEERLRILVNDPDQDIGSNKEMIPVSAPVYALYRDDVRKVAIDALRNRPEIQQAFDQLRTAMVRRDMQKNEKWPMLNLVAEVMLGDIKGNGNYRSAFRDQWGDTGYHVGFQFEQPWDNDTERAQLLRREMELRQQANQLKVTIDTVLLESVVSYRELVTAYRDMQGRQQALGANREELRRLNERLAVDTESEGGRTTAEQLQIILDAIERRQESENAFLDSVVAYNSSFTSLERARGTLLRTEQIQIDRVRDTDPTHPHEDVERLQLSRGHEPQKGSKSYAPKGYVPAKYSGTSDDEFFTTGYNNSSANDADRGLLNNGASPVTTPLTLADLGDAESEEQATVTRAVPVEGEPLKVEQPASGFFNFRKQGSVERKISIRKVSGGRKR